MRAPKPPLARKSPKHAGEYRNGSCFQDLRWRAHMNYRGFLCDLRARIARCTT
jgi:hypothetical protein